MAVHFPGLGGGHYSIAGNRHPQDATWTVELRVRFTSLTMNDTPQRLVWINTTSDLADAYAVGLIAGNLLSAGYTIGGVQVDDLFTFPVEIDRNYHIAVVFESGVSSRVYIDGQLVHTGTAQSYVPQDLAVGGANLGGDWQMHGAIACVRYWTAALTQEQIQASMLSSEPVTTTNLWDSWRFDNWTSQTSYPGDYNTHSMNNQNGGETAVAGDLDIVPPAGTTHQLAFTATAVADLLLTRGISKVLSRTASGSPTRICGISKAFQRPASGFPALSRGLFKSSSVTTSGSPALTRGVSKSLAFATSATPTLVRGLSKFSSAVTEAVVALSRGAAASINAGVTAAGTATLSVRSGLGLAFAATAEGAASLSKRVGKVFSVGAEGATAITRGVSKTLAATASGAVSGLASWVRRVSSSVTSLASISVSREYTEGDGTVEPILTLVRNILRSVGRAITRPTIRTPE